MIKVDERISAGLTCYDHFVSRTATVDSGRFNTSICAALVQVPDGTIPLRRRWTPTHSSQPLHPRWQRRQEAPSLRVRSLNVVHDPEYSVLSDVQTVTEWWLRWCQRRQWRRWWWSTNLCRQSIVWDCADVHYPTLRCINIREFSHLQTHEHTRERKEQIISSLTPLVWWSRVTAAKATTCRYLPNTYSRSMCVCMHACIRTHTKNIHTCIGGHSCGIQRTCMCIFMRFCTRAFLLVCTPMRFKRCKYLFSFVYVWFIRGCKRGCMSAY